MVLTSAAMVPGAYFQDAEINQLNKSAVAIVMGRVLMNDTADDNFKVATASATAKRFAVSTKDAAAADTKVEAAVSGHVAILAGGAIGPGNRVKVAATPDKVVEAVEGTDAFNTILGIYVGKSTGNERDGVTITAAADGDPIIVKLGLGGGGA